MEKGLRPEVTREQMYAVIEHLQEAIEAMIDDEVETEDAEMEQVGMKEKNGRMVPNCVPVEKSYDKEDKEEPIKKSIWNGTFIK